MNILLSTVFLVQKFLHFVLYPFVWYVPKEKRKRVSPVTDNILKITATDLASMIRKRQISSEDVVKAYVKRIKDVNPLINAVVQDRFESALKEAKSVDEYLNTTSLTEDELKKIKPLLGIPLTVKESCSVEGMSLSVGVVSRRGIKAEFDGEAVSRLKMCGAIPLLVSNTPVFSSSWECRNYITGATNNPFDVTCTSGGSSGGEGALLGAGASLIGLGADIAGSIRIPAMYCGVFGHKPTPKVIPIKGHIPYPPNERMPDYLVVGPMVRYAKDLSLMMQVMCGKKSTELGLNSKVDLGKICVYYMDDANALFQSNVQKEIKRSVKKAVKYLQDECKSNIIHDYKFKDLKNAEFSGAVLSQIETPIASLLKAENQNILTEILKSLTGASTITFETLLFTLSQQVMKFISTPEHFKINIRLKNNFVEKLGTNGVFIFPTMPQSACKHGEFSLKVIDTLYQTAFNTMGLPSTQVPCGKNSEGLPIGIQVVAAPNQDRLCLAVAEALEKCFGGWSL